MIVIRKPVAFGYIISGIFLSFVMVPFSFSHDEIKRPNVSGQFYEADPGKLSSQIDYFNSLAAIRPFQNHVDIIIAPHAGYIFSGPVAAYGFKAVSQNRYKTIIILAPSHYVRFDGISVWDRGGFQTPLGIVRVDEEFSKRLIASDEHVYFKTEPYEQEHSLEVEIPFLQKTFKEFSIVPVVMGQPSLQTMKKFVAALNEIIGAREDVLIVISTDLSHYHTDADARTIDARTIEAIKSLDVEGFIRGHESKKMESCGFIPVLTALLYAKEKGLNQAQVLRYANSSDVSKDLDRVVGYTSIIIYSVGESKRPKQIEEIFFSLEQQKRLVNIARTTIEEYVRKGRSFAVTENDPRLLKEDGAFVTLMKKGRLRGCMGHLIGEGPLYLTVRDMAIASASQDPRFSPVLENELSSLEVEVSVLSKPWRVKDPTEIIPGKHGAIVRQGHKSGVFLPQVWESSGWTREEFLSRLCVDKAGLPADAWQDPKTIIQIFTAESFFEQDFR